jgi:hypothetical protein
MPLSLVLCAVLKDGDQLLGLAFHLQGDAADYNSIPENVDPL